MKVFLALVTMFLSSLVFAQEAVDLPIALIDVQRVVEESAAGREAMGRVSRLNEEKLAEARKMVEEFEALQRQLSTQRATLTDARVAELQSRIEDKQVDLKRFEEDTRQELMEAERRELAELERRLMPVIEQIGRERNLKLIFNKFQAGLLFADDSVDITDEVLRRFNTLVSQ